MRLLYPFQMAGPGDITRTIFQFGLKTRLELLKEDLSDAYKSLAVTPSVFHKQTIKLCGLYFVDTRLLFGVRLSSQWNSD